HDAFEVHTDGHGFAALNFHGGDILPRGASQFSPAGNSRSRATTSMPRMRRSTSHILSTHGGNLPRPPDLDALLVKADEHREAIDKRLPVAVKEVVERQIECGVDIVNDGEYVKA